MWWSRWFPSVNLGKCLDSTLKEATTTAFHLFAIHNYHPTILHYITYEVKKKSSTKNHSNKFLSNTNILKVYDNVENKCSQKHCDNEILLEK
jgi:hypothetical protein